MADLQLGSNHRETDCIPKELVVSPDPYFFTRDVTR